MWQRATMHSSVTLKLKQLNGMQPSFVLLSNMCCQNQKPIYHILNAHWMHTSKTHHKQVIGILKSCFQSVTFALAIFWCSVVLVHSTPCLLTIHLFFSLLPLIFFRLSVPAVLSDLPIFPPSVILCLCVCLFLSQVLWWVGGQISGAWTGQRTAACLTHF